MSEYAYIPASTYVYGDDIEYLIQQGAHKNACMFTSASVHLM